MSHKPAPCQYTWDGGEGQPRRVCQGKGVQNPSVRVLNKAHICEPCQEEMVKVLMEKSGQNRKLVMLGMGLVGAKGRDQNSKLYKVLAGQALEKKGVSRQEIDRLKREAMKRGVAEDHSDGGIEG